MRGSLYLAWRYLAYHRYKTAILVTSITLIVYLPVGLQVVVGQSAEQLTSRARTTPLMVGARGSPLELVLNTLYFESESPEQMRHAEVTRISETGLARPVPLYVRFHARGHPIVGTTLDYFDFRELRIADGRQMAMLGECVIGAAVARDLGVGPDDAIVSSPESVFDLAGVYPLKMKVAGVLERSHGPDDRAIFVDLKTTWIIEGLGHGHQDLSRPEARGAVLERDGDTITANASVVQYTEIDPGNLDSFHFHGDLSDYPITAIVALPHDDKSGVLLRGRYQSAEDRSQILQPVTVMDELLATILTVQSYVVTAVAVVGVSTLATAALVFLLSLRLRRREIETMVKIGGNRWSIVSVLTFEIVVVIALSVTIAAGLTALTGWFGPAVIRSLILT
jgi:putative ABC transport system permease protein